MHQSGRSTLLRSRSRRWLVALLLCLLRLILNTTPSAASDFFSGFNFRSSGYPGRGSSGPVDTEYYKALGVEKGATESQIKRAYRQKAMQCHPDKGGNPEEFKKIAEAYEVLGDANKKKQYDQYGKSDFGPGFGAGAGMGGTAEDLFEEMFRGFSFGGAGASGFGGFNMGPQPAVFQINLRLEDFFNGKELDVEVKGGKRLKVKIEKGMLSGQELLVRGYTKDQFGNPRDLIFQLKQAEHDTFTRKNADLLVSIKISLQDALMGFTLPIKGLDGKELWIKCKHGDIQKVEDVLIISGQGMPVFQQPNVRGRLFVKTEVVLPSNLGKELDDKEIALLNKLLGKLDQRDNYDRKPKGNEPIVKAQRANEKSLPFGAFGEDKGRGRRRGGRSMMDDDDDDFKFSFQGANPFEQFFR